MYLDDLPPQILQRNCCTPQADALSRALRLSTENDKEFQGETEYLTEACSSKKIIKK